MSTAKTYRTSVKKLVDFACRSGDLVHTGPAGPTALEGQIAHKKLQKQKLSTEQAEVKVSSSITLDSLTLKLGGRVDLLSTPANSTDSPSVGEIKSCYAPPDKQPQSVVDLHWAQLKVYGYCVLSELNQSRLDAADDKIDTQHNPQTTTTPSRDSAVAVAHSSINLSLIHI